MLSTSREIEAVSEHPNYPRDADNGIDVAFRFVNQPTFLGGVVAVQVKSGTKISTSVDRYGMEFKAALSATSFEAGILIVNDASERPARAISLFPMVFVFSRQEFTTALQRGRLLESMVAYRNKFAHSAQ